MEKLNKFERTRIIAARALELGRGAKPKVKLTKYKDQKLSEYYTKVAEEELKKGVIELEIYRK